MEALSLALGVAWYVVVVAIKVVSSLVWHATNLGHCRSRMVSYNLGKKRFEQQRTMQGLPENLNLDIS